MEQTIIEDTEEASFSLNGMLAGVDEKKKSELTPVFFRTFNGPASFFTHSYDSRALSHELSFLANFDPLGELSHDSALHRHTFHL